MIVYGYLSSLLYGVLCLALGLIAYKLGMNKKYTRKLVHILVGFEWVILYHFMGNTVHFLIVCLAFVDNNQLGNISDVSNIDDPAALEVIYASEADSKLLTPEGESFVLSEKFSK